MNAKIFFTVLPARKELENNGFKYLIASPFSIGAKESGQFLGVSLATRPGSFFFAVLYYLFAALL